MHQQIFLFSDAIRRREERRGESKERRGEERRGGPAASTTSTERNEMLFLFFPRERERERDYKVRCGAPPYIPPIPPSVFFFPPLPVYSTCHLPSLPWRRLHMLPTGGGGGGGGGRGERKRRCGGKRERGERREEREEGGWCKGGRNEEKGKEWRGGEEAGREERRRRKRRRFERKERREMRAFLFTTHWQSRLAPQILFSFFQMNFNSLGRRGDVHLFSGHEWKHPEADQPSAAKKTAAPLRETPATQRFS